MPATSAPVERVAELSCGHIGHTCKIHHWNSYVSEINTTLICNSFQ